MSNGAAPVLQSGNTPQQKAADDPSTTSDAYDLMAGRWEIIDTVLGGTETMREAGQKFLPPHPAEKAGDYSARLKGAVLKNMLDDVLTNLSSKPFKEGIKVNEDVPQRIQDEILPDVDLQGNKLDIFCREWFRTGMGKGFGACLVDFPTIKGKANGAKRTLADDQREGVRPYWVQILPENIIFAYAEVINGVETLLHVRIREVEEELKPGQFQTSCTNRIKVLTPGQVTIYTEVLVRGKKIWRVSDQYSTGLDFIPLVIFYTAERDGLLSVKPPLLDLAYLNVAHWQSTADQRHILGVGRYPMLACSGAQPESGEDGSSTVVGPNQMLFTPDPQGKFYYVEPQGTAIAAGERDLQKLEDDMASYGAEFMKKKTQKSTATARVLDNSEAVSPLQAISLSFEDAVAKALDYTAMWMKLPGGEGGTVELSKEFSNTADNQFELTTLTTARTNRDISRVAFCNELVRRNILPEDYDVEEDAVLLAQESIMMGEGSTEINPNADPTNDPESNVQGQGKPGEGGSADGPKGQTAKGGPIISNGVDYGASTQ